MYYSANNGSARAAISFGADICLEAYDNVNCEKLQTIYMYIAIMSCINLLFVN